MALLVSLFGWSGWLFSLGSISGRSSCFSRWLRISSLGRISSNSVNRNGKQAGNQCSDKLVHGNFLK